VVVVDSSLFLFASSAPSSSGNMAGMVFNHWLCRTAVLADPDLQRVIAEISQDGIAVRAVK
jgi:hypothetical protein